MAAKKMPAKKMAAPKKTSKTADSSKLTPSQKKNLAASAKMRTDAAGRSGMGETAISNIRFKGGNAMSSANKTALAAADKASKSGGSPTTAFVKSLRAAGKAAEQAAAMRKKKKK
jgi:hypothetical protein